MNLIKQVNTEAKRLTKQLEVVKKSLERNPRDLNLLFQRGHIFYQLQKYEAAKDAFSKAIDVKPNFADGFNARSIVNHALSKFQEAQTRLTQAIVLKPEYAEAHRTLANMKTFHSQDEQYSKMRALYLNHINFSKIIVFLVGHLLLARLDWMKYK